MELLIDGHHGVYIPKLFCSHYAENFEGIDKEDIETCLNPDSDWYWESWDNILTNAFVVRNGKKYILWQDCDLFLIAEDEEVELC